MSSLARRGMRPIEEIGRERPHGDRLRYLAGCKCFHCRRANSDYERERKAARAAGDWNGIVSARSARTHLNRLSRQGIGRRAVSDASDVGETTLCDIRSGRKKYIRARTERKILAVDAKCLADGALVSAGRTWQYIRLLVEEGYTQTYLAQQLGYPRSLQFGKERVTVKNAARVKALYRRLTT